MNNNVCYHEKREDMDKLFSKLPSASTTLKVADKATTYVCYYATLKRAKSTLGLIVVWFVVMYMTSGSEDRLDLVGEIEEVTDSGVLEVQKIHKVVPSRKAYKGSVVESSQETNCREIETIKPDGNVVKSQKCDCRAVDVKYTNDGGSEEITRCPPFPIKCPTDFTSMFVVEQDGRKICTMQAPNIHCKINDSTNTKSFTFQCPKVGSDIQVVRTTNGTILLPEGNWNNVRLKIKYMDDRGVYRHQIIHVPMNEPGNLKYQVGSTIPVFYSPKHKKIFLSDWNGSSMSSMIRLIVGMIAFFKLVDCLSFLNYYVCRIRLGAKAFDAIESKVGFEI